MGDGVEERVIRRKAVEFDIEGAGGLFERGGVRAEIFQVGPAHQSRLGDAGGFAF